MAAGLPPLVRVVLGKRLSPSGVWSFGQSGVATLDGASFPAELGAGAAASGSSAVRRLRERRNGRSWELMSVALGREGYAAARGWP
jgi:hypothetical protein